MGDDESERFMVGSLDWRNPDLFAFESERCLSIKNYDGTLPLVLWRPDSNFQNVINVGSHDRLTHEKPWL